MTKQEQTKKVKRVDLKHMSHIELKLLKEFIFSKSDGKCQCGCGRPIDVYHHSNRGINKDDRTIVGIAALPCHHDVHFSIDSHKRESLTILLKSIAIENWREYNE